MGLITSNSLSIVNLSTASSLTNVLVYDSSTGGITYTGSSAIGGGGGGVGTLQQVTDNGNTTTNNININNSSDIIFDIGGEVVFGSGGGVLLDNNSRLREGTTDAGTGGTKGIAQICAVGYELKWEAGSQYVMDGNGLLIREVNHKFNTAPSATNDDTEGFYVGSRWILDDGTIYVCSDASTGAAVWVLKGYTYLEVTRAEADGLIATNAVVEDALYKITDVGSVGPWSNPWTWTGWDLGTFLTGISSSSFSISGYREMLCPAQYVSGVDGFGNDWVGIWYPALVVSVGQLAIRGGKAWENLTGNVGTAPDSLTLDATNWVLRTNTNNEYMKLKFDIKYDYGYDWISEQSDFLGNVMGAEFIYFTDIHGSSFNGVDATDWNLASGSVILFANNKAHGIFNNRCVGGANYSILNNNINGLIADNLIGDSYYISGNKLNNTGNIANNEAPAGIYSNILTSGEITNNVLSGGLYYNVVPGPGSISGNTCSDIYSNSCNGGIQNNTNTGGIAWNKCAGGIATNSNTGDIYQNTNAGSIEDNGNAGDILFNSNTGDVSTNGNSGEIRRNSNNGSVNNNTHLGDIVGNSNNGTIAFNTNLNYISINNNTGDILGNTNTGIISANSNFGYITNNSNDGYIVANHCTGIIAENENSSNITGNRNNGAISSNLVGIQDIYYNSNNGTIASNVSNGSINLNSNNGSIFSNTNIILISQNSNNGDIFSISYTGVGPLPSIRENVNNGTISGAQSGTVSDTVVDK
jgi:hypothetical protein